MTNRRSSVGGIASLTLLAGIVGASSAASAFSIPGSLSDMAPAVPTEVKTAVAPALADKVTENLLPQVVDQLGTIAFKATVRMSTVSTERSYQERVNRVIKPIVDEAKRGRYAAVAKSFQWDTAVLKGDQINAIAFPGGKIVVYEELLVFTKDNDAELAAVLGHEMVHALARHAAQRIDAELRRELSLALTGKQLVDEKALSPAAAAGLMVAMGLVHEGTVMRPFSRAHESEADHEGVLLAGRAGYDPTAAISFWQARKQRSDKFDLTALFLAHPSDDTRIHQLQGWMPEALALHHNATGQQASAATDDRSSRTR